MNIASLHQDAMRALADEPDKNELHRLANMAWQLAEMVGWAPGVIDTDGRVLAAFKQVREAARKRFETDQNQDIAALHDALADLMDAIARHDRDLLPVSSDDDDVVDV